MGRRRAFVERPKCTHRQAEWDAYARSYAWRGWRSRYGDEDPWPERPEHDGYCDPCWTALCQSAEPWPAEVWAKLDAMAAADYHTGPTVDPWKPRALPAYQGPRYDKPEKWLERCRKAFDITAEPLDPGAHARCKGMIGRSLGVDERTGISWSLETTNAHVALALPGPGTGEPSKYLPMSTTSDWLDLPPAFHVAVKRVRLFANERSSAIRLTANADGTVTLAARCAEYGEASETIDVIVGNLAGGLFDRTTYETTLSANYLDPICGIWPLRWYLRPPAEKQDPPTRLNPNPKPRLEELPQLFEVRAEATGKQPALLARVFIMPMRV
jgi:hypothetical protein